MRSLARCLPLPHSARSLASPPFPTQRASERASGQGGVLTQSKREREREIERKKEREKERKRDRERKREKKKERKIEREEERKGGRERAKKRERENERKREREKARTREREKDRKREREKERKRERKREREKERKRETEKKKTREREKERKRERENERTRGREKERKGERENERTRERKEERKGGREKERKRERERESVVWRALVAPHSLKPSVLLLIRCPQSTVLLDMVGLDHMAVGIDVAAVVESQKYAPSQQCGAGNWWSRTDCRHCVSVTNDTADAPQTSLQEKIALLEKTLAGMEKELEKHQKKLNGPVGSTENPNASRPRARSWRRCRRISEYEGKL